MKKIFLFALISFCANWAKAAPVTVPYTLTSASAGPCTVSIGSASGVSASGSGCFTSGYGYKISGSSGSITFLFSVPVSGIFFDITNIDNTEDISFFDASSTQIRPANINFFPCSGFARAIYGGIMSYDMVAAIGGVNSEGTAGFANCAGMSQITIVYSPGIGSPTGAIDFDLVIEPTYAKSISAPEGINNVCVGANLQLTADASSGGIWSSSGPALTVSSTGNVTGVAAGTATVSYGFPAACFATYTIQVNPNPVSIPLATLPSVACLAGTGTGISINLASTPNPSLKYVLWQNNIVTGSFITGTTSKLFPGTFNCTQTSLSSPLPPDVFKVFCIDPATGCSDLSSGTNVTGIPDITGVPTMYLCTLPTPSTTTLFANCPGTWSSSNPADLPIGLTSGVVTAITPATATISFSGGGCVNVIGVDALACKPGGNGNNLAQQNTFTEFKAYPNPTNGQLALEAPVAGIFRITTIDGRVIAEHTLKAGINNINLPAHLAEGMYLGHFNGNDGSISTARITYQRE